ncbi:MAG: hypothetical protein LBL63_07130 [Clostridiales Family XIII bacterium]|jgi:hypothetical protein|nr:hypothetical protein [Clostridiales Family XIII bacterium]
MDLKEFAKSKLGILEDAVITVIDRREDQRVLGKAPERSYKVQFNPSELVLDASNPLDVFSGAESADATGAQEGAALQTRTPEAFLTLNLIFDEVNIADAFSSGMLTSSVTELVKGAATFAKKAKVGGTSRDWSVQPIVEGFIGAIRNEFTRLLRLDWGEFRFTGFLEHLHAEYTMFSPSGNPIRARVSMRLKNDMDSDLIMWSDYLFPSDKDMTAIALGGTGKTGIVGKALNIGW